MVDVAPGDVADFEPVVGARRQNNKALSALETDMERRKLPGLIDRGWSVFDAANLIGALPGKVTILLEVLASSINQCSRRGSVCLLTGLTRP